MTDRSPRLEASECQSKHTVKFHPASSLSSLTAAVLQTAARRPRESEKYDDERRQADLYCDGHWDAHCVLRALAIVPLFFSLFFFFARREALKKPDHGHCCPLWMMIVVKLMRTYYYSLLGMKYEKYGLWRRKKEVADQKEKWCSARTYPRISTVFENRSKCLILLHIQYRLFQRILVLPWPRKYKFDKWDIFDSFQTLWGTLCFTSEEKK